MRTSFDLPSWKSHNLNTRVVQPSPPSPPPSSKPTILQTKFAAQTLISCTESTKILWSTLIPLWCLPLENDAISKFTAISMKWSLMQHHYYMLFRCSSMQRLYFVFSCFSISLVLSTQHICVGSVSVCLSVCVVI